VTSIEKIRKRIATLRRLTRARGATAGEEQAAKEAIDRLQVRLHIEKKTEPETLADYMIREMAAELRLQGSGPGVVRDFCDRAEEERERLEHGPWNQYEERIRQKWEQGRSYSADLAEALRRQHDEWEARERWRAARNQQRKAEDARRAARKLHPLTDLFKRLKRVVSASLEVAVSSPDLSLDVTAKRLRILVIGLIGLVLLLLSPTVRAKLLCRFLDRCETVTYTNVRVCFVYHPKLALTSREMEAYPDQPITVSTAAFNKQWNFSKVA